MICDDYENCHFLHCSVGLIPINQAGQQPGAQGQPVPANGQPDPTQAGQQPGPQQAGQQPGPQQGQQAEPAQTGNTETETQNEG